ncbi:MAG: HAMP domain-containing protein [Deltaproteobacteria bacterium]|nr:HAMP domain-containing protein [Deltaproteobacteria bacterium]
MAGPGILPLALAVLLLFPVFRQEIFESQGLTLAREASFLAAEVEVYLRTSSDLGRAREVVASFRRGQRGRAYLYDETGARLAGLPDLPALPESKESRPRLGWRTFELGRAAYVAGVASVRTDGATPSRPAGSWVLAVVQPESEVLAPLYRAVETVALFFFAVFALCAFFSWRLAEVFLAPLRKLRQGAEIVSRTNLAHRIDIRTGDELEALAGDFNRMAESLQRSYGELEERVRDTTLHLAGERNRLAAVLQTMAEGVVMANEAGRVVLVTPRARLALGGRASSGIGAPLADLLPADRLDFHLRRIRRAWGEGREAAEDVIFPLADGRLLRGVLSAVRGPAGELAGFLFVFRDLGAEGGEGEKPLEALREIPQLLKGPAATLRSLADVLEARPDMPEAKRRDFVRAVREEVSRLGERLDQGGAELTYLAPEPWDGSLSTRSELLLKLPEPGAFEHDVGVHIHVPHTRVSRGAEPRSAGWREPSRARGRSCSSPPACGGNTHRRRCANPRR